MKPFGNLDLSPFEDYNYEKHGLNFKSSGRTYIIPIKTTANYYEHNNMAPLQTTYSMKSIGNHDHYQHYENYGFDNHHHHDQSHLVFVTFHTHSDKKMVEMYLDKNRALQQVAAKAAELLPSRRWRLFEGTSTYIGQEFLTSQQICNAITYNQNLGNYYLSIRQLPADDEGVTCRKCFRMITGHRFKCTQCADFDICAKCEAKMVHSGHAMLRIVDGVSHIPRYIIDNAPKFVFYGY